MPVVKHAVSFSSAGHRRGPLSRLNTEKNAIHETRVVVFDMPVDREKSEGFSAETMAEFVNHVHIYADVLFSWQLYHKRLELLKSVSHYDAAVDSAQHDIGLTRSCAKCRDIEEEGKGCVPGMHPALWHAKVHRLSLPVKGLSRSCLRCLHVTHISCWKRLDVPICPSGCGCLCENRGFAYGAPFASLPASTPITASRPSSKGAM
ncbi:hypothetical protein B0H17DRAFT_115355 [Mycena rosella]|uniref:WDR59/RTC1-like RING zinc finger domain-containing protein n=1 Tax=Mycena rosella TaxID=1033263 RepID=A0AAD7AXD3_MYCRO|nr:hypothetical protein B0H17DRAFT_115355 [Mycena rosella]